MNNIEFIDARDLFGDNPILAEIAAEAVQLDDDDRQLVLKLIERLKRDYEKPYQK